MSQRVICADCHKMFPSSERTYICVWCQNTFCENCKKKLVTNKRCTICTRYLRVNDDIKVNRMHFEDEGIINTNNLCAFHRYELTFFCTNCKQYCCIQCAKEKHRNCKVIEEKNVMAEQKPVLKEFGVHIKALIDKLEKIKSEREKRVDEFISQQENYLDLLSNKIQNKIKQQKTDYLEEQNKKLQEKIDDTIELRNRIFFNSLGYDLNKPCDKNKEALVLKYKDYFSKSLVYNQDIYKSVNLKDLVPNFEKQKRVIKFERNKTLLHESFQMLNKMVELNLDKKGIFFDLVLNVMGLPNQPNDQIDLLEYYVQVNKGMDIFYAEGQSKNGQIESKEFIPIADIQYDVPYMLKIKLRYSSYSAKLRVLGKVFNGVEKNAINKSEFLKYDKIIESKESTEVETIDVNNGNDDNVDAFANELNKKVNLHKSEMVSTSKIAEIISKGNYKARGGKNYFENFEENYEETPGFDTRNSNSEFPNRKESNNSIKKRLSGSCIESGGNYMKKNSDINLRKSHDESNPPFKPDPKNYYQNNMNNRPKVVNNNYNNRFIGIGPNNQVLNDKKNNTGNNFNRTMASNNRQGGNAFNNNFGGAFNQNNNFNRTTGKLVGSNNGYIWNKK